MVYAVAKTRLAEACAAMEQVTIKVDVVLASFEPNGSPLTEALEARTEAVWGRLEGFVKRVAKDAVQYTLGLVKSHIPEANQEPMGDGVGPDTSEDAWEVCLSSVKPVDGP
jgi:hypothetical protein